MASINAVIVDDEPKLQEVLSIKLKKNCPQVHILGSAENIEDAYELISRVKPNLVFLDISMPGGTGFDLLEKFEKPSFEVVFVTGYSEYAIQALKLSAADYLLKPLNTKDLISAVFKVEEKLNLEFSQRLEKLEVLKSNLNQQTDQHKKVVIPNDKGYEFVKLKDIVRIEGWQKYTKIHTVQKEVFVSSYNIGVYKEMLDDQMFFQTHKSHIINDKFIKSYSKEGLLYLEDGSEVPVARRKKEEFLKKYVKLD